MTDWNGLDSFFTATISLVLVSFAELQKKYKDNLGIIIAVSRQIFNMIIDTILRSLNGKFVEY